MSKTPLVALFLAASLQAALPEPPRQHSPWQAVHAAGIPDYIPDLVAMLFDAGLADPRGGEYREIDVPVAGEKATIQTTHGWYFPQGFAVCWDGTVHRVNRAGARADLYADVAAAREHWGGATLVAPPHAEQVGMALLLRLGEPALAWQMYEKANSATELPLSAESEHWYKVAWFEDAGRSWLTALFHEAVRAHAGGDNSYAIDIARFGRR